MHESQLLSQATHTHTHTHNTFTTMSQARPMKTDNNCCSRNPKDDSSAPKFAATHVCFFFDFKKRVKHFK